MYAMYLRKSRQDMELELLGQGETLARHRETLMNLARKNLHTIGEIYAEVVSGETIRARPEMKRLLADVSAGRWEGVYCMEVERLSRGDPVDQGRVAEVFTVSQTRIITPAKTYFPENDYDVEYFEFSLFMSRREYKAINRRIQAGRMYSVREGKYIGSRPAYGYRKAKLQGEKGYTLAVHPAEAEIVQEIFRLYIHQNMGPTEIARHLTQTAAPVGIEGKGWSACRVHRLLCNEVYIGMLRWGKTRIAHVLDASGAMKRRVTSPSYELYPGRHEPIISEEDFACAQAKLHRSNRPSHRHSLTNPLSGLLVCSACGAVMHGLPAYGRQAASIFCPTPGCPNVKTYRAPVLCAMLDILSPWLSSRWRVPASAASPLSPQHGDSTWKRLEKELALIHGQMERLQELLEQNVYTVAQYRQRFSALTARCEQVSQRLAEASAAAASPALSRDSASSYRIGELFAGASAGLQNLLLRTCLEKVVFRKETRGHANGSGITQDAHQFTLILYPRRPDSSL